MHRFMRFGVPLIVFVCALAVAGQHKNPLPSAKPAAAPTAARLDAHGEAARVNNIGVAYMNRQQFADALVRFQAACIKDPASDIACLNMGIAMSNLQRYEEARQVLSKFAEHNPKSPYAWFNLGLIEKSSGQSAPAIEDFETVEALDANDADTQYFLGLLYSQEQHYDKAIDAFEKALKLNPFHLSAEFGLAQALQRSGNKSAAKEHLDRFQRMTAEKTGKPISATYGEQGKYSLVQSLVPAPETVPPAIPVHFVVTTPTSGLPSQPSATNSAHAHQTSSAHANMKSEEFDASSLSAEIHSLAAFLGSGACILDYDGDGKPDIFLVNATGKGDAALFRNIGDGKFVDVTRAAKLEIHGEGMGCAVGDYDNDGHVDLAVSMNGRIALYHNEGNGTFKDVTDSTGIHMDGLNLGLNFIDYDHDGDLDLYVTRFTDFPIENPRQPFAFPDGAAAPGNVLWRNNGSGKFIDWTKETALGGTSPSVGSIGSDLNNDRAIDFVITGWQKSPTILLNPREGAFHDTIPFGSEVPPATAGVVALDFNKDGWMDLAFTHWSPPGLSLWRNVEGKSFERMNLPDLGWMRGWGVAAFDYDNDGWVDLVAVGETFSGEGRIALLRNEGPAGFRDVTAETGLDKVVLHDPRGVIAFDYDGDGATDLLITQNHLPPVLLKNVGGNRHNWLQLAFKGEHDNKTGIGTKVEVWAGTLQQKWEIPGASGYLGQGPTDIIAGLDDEPAADIVRLLWPTGVFQDELDVAAGKHEAIAELDRRGSSCPILFVWNGQRFEFLADVIGPGIVGHWFGPNERNVPNPEEYFKVSGSSVQIQNGRIRFRMVEPMEELDYLDQTRLLAVDHPSDVEVYPDAHFATYPPFPKFKVIASRDAHLPAGAWDDRGRSVLPLLAKRDRKYVTDFRLLPYDGFAEMHALELDLGPWDSTKPLRLLMDGFTEYFSANSLYGAWQAGIRPISPYVEALDRSGNWVRVADDIGFPAGLARTMVADLTGKLPPGTTRIRIKTNLRIFWDRIRVDNSDPNLPFRTVEIPLAKAHLNFRGYPRVVEGHPADDLTYVYEDVSPTGPYARQIGNYTRYGDVTELLRASDDEYVIFGSGDEVAVDFDATHMPALPAGWTRDYFFFADGYAKDMDFYAKYGETVAPLPFHTLIPYPYTDGVGYPEDERHLNYILEYNTRGVAGPAGPLYRFNYPKR